MFGSGANTDNMPSTTLTASDFADGQLGILDMLYESEFSSFQERRSSLVEQGGISVNDVKNYQPYRTIYGRKL